MTFTIDNENSITVFATPGRGGRHYRNPIRHLRQPARAGRTGQGLADRALGRDLEQPGGRYPGQALQEPTGRRPAGSGSASRTWAKPRSPRRPPREAESGKKGQGWRTVRQGRACQGQGDQEGHPRQEAAPKGKKAAKAQEAAGPREGSKTAQVIAMLQRKNGATLSEIMEHMGWQRHTVRGFMAGAMKKAGYTVESLQARRRRADLPNQLSSIRRLLLPGPPGTAAAGFSASGLDSCLIAPSHHTPSRSRANEREPNVRDERPTLGWPAAGASPRSHPSAAFLLGAKVLPTSATIKGDHSPSGRRSGRSSRPYHSRA